MRKFTFIKSLMLVCMLMVGMGAWAAKTYTKVTDASTLAENDVIILACDAKKTYAGAMGANSYLSSVDDKANAIEITLGKSGGNWTLTTSEGAIGTSAAKKMTKDSGTTTWTISISNGDATITSTDNSCGSISYNASSPRFLNYTSSQTAIQIYKVTGSADPLPQHTAHFSVNGTVNAGDDCVVSQNDAITFPANPADVYGRKFQGWTQIADYSSPTTAPSDLCKEAKMGTTDVTYYAVFANVVVGEDIPTTFYYEPFTGTAHSTGFTSDNVAATQSMFYDKSATVWSHYTDTKAPSTSSYATNLDGSAMSNEIKIYKQINNTTATILEVKGIDIRNAKNLNVSLYNRRSYTNATLSVEYKIDNAANYTATGGTITYNSTNDKWKLTDGLQIPGTGSTLDLKISVKVTGTTNRIMVIDDVKVYGDLNNITYSDYCTNVPSTATITLNAACHDEDNYVYGTYSNTSAFVVPSNITVYEASVDEENVTLRAYATDAVVPANTGVLICAHAGGNHEVQLTNAAGSSVLGANNALRPTGNGITAAQMATAAPGKEYFRLTMHNDTDCGFWWGAADGAAFNLGANKAYLVADPSASPAKGFTLGQDAETAISAIKAQSKAVRYNLAGQRVDAAYKGIVIVNGKKVVK